MEPYFLDWTLTDAYITAYAALLLAGLVGVIWWAMRYCK